MSNRRFAMAALCCAIAATHPAAGEPAQTLAQAHQSGQIKLEASTPGGVARVQLAMQNLTRNTLWLELTGAYLIPRDDSQRIVVAFTTAGRRGTVEIQAGSRWTGSVTGFCMDEGKPSPGQGSLSLGTGPISAWIPRVLHRFRRQRSASYGAVQRQIWAGAGGSRVPAGGAAIAILSSGQVLCGEAVEKVRGAWTIHRDHLGNELQVMQFYHVEQHLFAATDRGLYRFVEKARRWMPDLANCFPLKVLGMAEGPFAVLTSSGRVFYKARRLDTWREMGQDFDDLMLLPGKGQPALIAARTGRGLHRLDLSRKQPRWVAAGSHNRVLRYGSTTRQLYRHHPGGKFIGAFEGTGWRRVVGSGVRQVWFGSRHLWYLRADGALVGWDERSGTSRVLASRLGAFESVQQQCGDEVLYVLRRGGKLDSFPAPPG